jgi:hypothetical protein
VAVTGARRVESASKPAIKCGTWPGDDPDLGDSALVLAIADELALARPASDAARVRVKLGRGRPGFSDVPLYLAGSRHRTLLLINRSVYILAE